VSNLILRQSLKGDKPIVYVKGGQTRANWTFNFLFNYWYFSRNVGKYSKYGRVDSRSYTQIMAD